ncbi:MAG: hypothetical protein AAFY83_05220 [Pseudomonadota bacterium]
MNHPFAEGRHGWVQIARGGIEINDHILQPGDGLAISDLAEIEMEALSDAEVLLFDLA